MASGIDKNGSDIRSNENEVGTIKDLIRNIGESVCSLVELEAVTSALEQQDEVDRKQWMNEPHTVGEGNGGGAGEDEVSGQIVIGYNPSVINFLGHPFKRQNLIYCRRVLIETFIL